MKPTSVFTPPSKLREDEDKLKRIARTMKTIGHPSRLMIVELLLEKGKLPVKEIYECVNISQSNASQHLKALEDIGILSSEREGKNICYRVQNMTVDKLLQCVNECTDC
jgi:DNA-binding transcriptional ArsR family regulator